ncbi:hypothetical protein GAY35_14215 [Staphylococcus aureus]|nr:hypothetical protein CGL53_26345 [Salmonella enterica subsp. enterica serovar Indiana]ASN59107.1 hypothetical protein CGL53_26410 [Salmonella enterica subsp. enterica serovar Indiana]MUH18001.1 hypothetical protein [Staphylococcus aureus]MUH34208.1 hypothetical protein [Staphylococcus aureus]
MGSCAAPSAKGDDKFITTDYLQQCRTDSRFSGVSAELLIKKHSTQSEILCNSGCTAQGLFIS